MAARLDTPDGAQRSAPAGVSVPFSAWTEYCQVADLDMDQCPTCNKDIPGNFLMFRPHGLEFWRCLMCLVKTQNAGALHLSRTTDTGLD